MTDVLIKRELLERLAAPLPGDNGWQTWHTIDMVAASLELRAILAAPRQPEGDGLEVVAWQDADNPLYTTAERRVMHEWTSNDYLIVELCRLSDAQRAIAELREECERLRMQLAACGVVALANTPESAAQARQMHPDYMSASCSDVADAVDREIALRQQLAERDVEIERGAIERSELRKQIAERDMEILAKDISECKALGDRNKAREQRDRLTGLLREADDWLCVLRQDGGYSRTKELSGRIAAALSALK